MESIFNRVSVRKFLSKAIEEEKLRNILQAGMQAPSAHNYMPWEFLVVTDREDSKEIATMSPYSRPAENAPVNIVLLANMDIVKKEELWWQQDMSACAENILLQSVEEGLGGVWLGFYPEKERCEKIKKYFSLPDHILPFAVISIGYPEKSVQPKEKCDWSKVHYNKY